MDVVCELLADENKISKMIITINFNSKTSEVLNVDVKSKVLDSNIQLQTRGRPRRFDIDPTFSSEEYQKI